MAPPSLGAPLEFELGLEVGVFAWRTCGPSRSSIATKLSTSSASNWRSRRRGAARPSRPRGSSASGRCRVRSSCRRWSRSPGCARPVGSPCRSARPGSRCRPCARGGRGSRPRPGRSRRGAHEHRPLLGVSLTSAQILVRDDLGVQDAVGQRELADVVQQPGGVDDVLFGLAAAELVRQRRAYRATAAAWRAVIRSRTPSALTSVLSTPSCSPTSCIERASSCSARSSERSSATARYRKIRSTTTAANSAGKPRFV